MAEPLARMESGSESVLTDAAHRLERAIQVLEVALTSGRTTPPSPSADSAPVVELETVRQRNRELETAAGEASRALGRAMVEVQLALQDDEEDPQASLFDAGLLDEAPPRRQDRLDSPLESGRRLGDDQDGTEAADPAAHKEPTE